MDTAGKRRWRKRYPETVKEWNDKSLAYRMKWVRQDRKKYPEKYRERERRRRASEKWQKTKTKYYRTDSRNRRKKWDSMAIALKVSSLINQALREMEKTDQQLGKADVRYYRLLVPRLNACTILTNNWKEEIRAIGKETLKKREVK